MGNRYGCFVRRFADYRDRAARTETWGMPLDWSPSGWPRRCRAGMTGGARGPAGAPMMSKHGIGILLGRLVGLGSLAALIAVEMASGPASIAPAPQTLT